MLQNNPQSCPLQIPRQRLSAWYDGLLDTAAIHQLGEHVQKCAACQQCIKEFAMIKNKLASHETLITPEQNWRGLHARMLLQQAPGKVTPWRVIAAILTVVLAVVFVSQVLLPHISNPPSSIGIGPLPTRSIANLLTDAQAWGKYPKTMLSLTMPDGGTFHPTDITADGKSLTGYVSHANTVAVTFALLSVPSGVLQPLMTYTPQAPGDALFVSISGHYAVIYDDAVTGNSVQEEYFDLDTHTLIHVNTGGLFLQRVALDHDLLILTSLSNTTGSLYALNIVTHAQFTIATNVDLELVSNISWPYLVYMTDTTNEGHLYNLATHQDMALAQSVQSFMKVPFLPRLDGTTLITSKLIATSSSSVAVALVEATHIDTLQPVVTSLTTALPQDANLLGVDQRLILVVTSVDTYAWDRAQRQLVHLIGNRLSFSLIGDYLLQIDTQSVTIIDTRQLPTVAP